MSATDTPTAKAAKRGPKPAKQHKTGYWRMLVLLLVHVLIGLHVWHYYSTGETLSPLEPSEAMAFSKDSVINAGLVLFVVATLATLVLGRYFCGWGCHILALQDLCRWLMMRIGITPKPLRSRLLAWVPFLAFLYMFIWPPVYRLWIGVPFEETRVAYTTQDFWRTFPGVGVALLTFFVTGFACVYVLGAKGFCTYACPYGGIFGAVDRLALGRIRVTDACEGCAHCSVSCSSNVAVAVEVRNYGMVVDPNCMKCMDCVATCPTDALYFGFGKPALGAKPKSGKTGRRPHIPWKEESMIAVLFILALAAFRGLYGIIPFLMALGLASCIAYAYLLLWRMRKRASVKLQNLVLRKDGSNTALGKIYTTGLLLFLPLWGHSGLVQYHRGELAKQFPALDSTRHMWMYGPLRPLNADEEARIAEVGEHARWLEDWSLVAGSDSALALGWQALWNRDTAGFLAESTRAAQRGMADPRLFVEQARVLLSVNQLQQAEQRFRSALEIAPNHLAAITGLAELRAGAGDYSGALAGLDAAIALNQGIASLHHDRAVLLTVMQRMPEAIEAFQTCLTLDARHGDASAKLAGLFFQSSKPAEAIQVLEAGVQANPESPDARSALAQLLIVLRRFEEAARQLQAAVDQAPLRADLHAHLAEALLGIGDNAGATAARAEAERLQAQFK